MQIPQHWVDAPTWPPFYWMRIRNFRSHPCGLKDLAWFTTWNQGVSRQGKGIGKLTGGTGVREIKTLCVGESHRAKLSPVMKDIEPVNLDLTPFKEPQGIRDYHVSRPLGDSLDSPNHPLWGDVSPRSYPESWKLRILQVRWHHFERHRRPDWRTSVLVKFSLV